MSLCKHAQYKESGLPLTPMVPSHWRRSALKYLGDYQNGYPFKPEDRGEEGLPIIRISQLTSNDEPAYFKGELDQRVKIATGDLLFSWSATIDSFIWSKGDAWLNQHIFKVTESQEASKDFLYYVIKHVAPKLADFDAHGSTMRHIKKESLGEKLYIPTQLEQLAITSFLDRETAKIDALIAEQQRLIELLQEKRQAAISHAVTKGLNPNAPMKDSGVEWLGEVPEHWGVRRLRFIGTLQNGLNIGGEAFGEGDPFISYGDVYNNPNLPQKPAGLVRSTREDKQKYGLERGDVLFTRTSETVDDIGVASICLEQIQYATFAGFLIRLRPWKEVLEPRYSTHLLRNQGVKTHFAGTMNMVTRASLSQGELGNLAICVPPLEEQLEIANSIEKMAEQSDHFISSARKLVALLQERRSALISAAVTGQIDVRGLAPEAVVQ